MLYLNTLTNLHICHKMNHQTERKVTDSENNVLCHV